MKCQYYTFIAESEFSCSASFGSASLDSFSLSFVVESVLFLFQMCFAFLHHFGDLDPFGHLNLHLCISCKFHTTILLEEPIQKRSQTRRILRTTTAVFPLCACLCSTKYSKRQ